MGRRWSWRRAYQSPTLHFVALGLLAFLTLQDRLTPAEVLVVDPGLMQQTVAQWESLQRGPVTAAQRERIREQLARSELLIRLARDAGLDRSAAVELRLLQLARFLGLVPETADDEAAIAAARAMDLDRTDTVIRRYLETTAETLLASSADRHVDEAEIEIYYERNAGEFLAPRRVRMRHVFIAGDTPEQEARAHALREQLIAEAVSPAAAPALGDPFYGAQDTSLRSQRQLADGFGQEFARAVSALPVGEWSRPLPSAYGLHLVYVLEAEEERRRPLATVRDDIVARILRERRREALAQRLAELRTRYHVMHPGERQDQT